MNITLSVNKSEREKIGKTLTNELTLSGHLRDETSVLSPQIVIEIENPTQYNYCHIPQFHRYYFISGMTSVRTGIWRLDLRADPLESFKSQILAQEVILNDSEENGASDYLRGNQWESKVKTLTDIINFPAGLLDSGEYILITAGG